MRIKVEITKSELLEDFADEQHLKDCIVEDLDEAREYPGYSVEVVVLNV